MEGMPPLVNYVTFNRLGLTARNLKSVLDTPEEFEMHIVDSNSMDDTWEYIQDLNDGRIKSKTRLPLNYGPIYPANLNLLKRKPEQYFFTIDSDVLVMTRNWVKCFLSVFKAFPEAGLLGVMKGKPYPRYLPKVLPKVRDRIGYLQLKNGFADAPNDFVPGCFQCLRPELIEEIGFWNEECCYGDAEISARVNNYTSFKAGFINTVKIDMTQSISCENCLAKKWCRLDKINNTCFKIRDKYHKNVQAAVLFKQKYLEVFKELKEGSRTAYSPSILAPESIKGRIFHKEWAEENFKYYIDNSNLDKQ